jgi:hypothetical protein
VQVIEKPSYLKALLTSQGNLYAGLGSFATGALLSLPFGLGVGLLPLLLYVTAASIASLYVPSLKSFRDRVDNLFNRQQRSVAREHLCREISLRAPGVVWEENAGAGAAAVPNTGNPPRYRQRGDKNAAVVADQAAAYQSAYRQMCERVSSLKMIAADRQTQMSNDDIDRLEDTTLDYLSLWLASLVTDDRSRSVDQDDVRRRISDLDAQLANAADTPESRQLRRAKSDYTALLARQSAMQTKRQAIEAAMMAMPDQIEEIYQMIMAAPYSSSISSKLDESLSKLRLQEELEQELDEDLRDTVPSLPERPILRALPTNPAVEAAKQAAASVKR